MSAVMGKGFPVEKIPAEAHPTVLMFATGALLGPLRCCSHQQHRLGRVPPASGPDRAG